MTSIEILAFAFAQDAETTMGYLIYGWLRFEILRRARLAII
jgi:hypothetical protein